jgi:hypothetical protein
MDDPANPIDDLEDIRHWVNPTREEIRQWAYDPDAVEPMQDWHLIIWGTADLQLLIDLASDPMCPKADYALWLLYGRVGDHARREGRKGLDRASYGLRDPDLMAYLSRDDTPSDAGVARWKQRSKALLNDSSLFDYEDWCWGRLRRTDEPWPSSSGSDQSERSTT